MQHQGSAPDGRVGFQHPQLFDHTKWKVSQAALV